MLVSESGIVYDNDTGTLAIAVAAETKTPVAVVSSSIIVEVYVPRGPAASSWKRSVGFKSTAESTVVALGTASPLAVDTRNRDTDKKTATVDH